MNTALRATPKAMNIGRMEPLFPLGNVCATPGALEAIEKGKQAPMHFLSRHVTGDWLEMTADDIQANTDALREGGRIFSAYTINGGARLYVITEEDRSTTTLLMADEY
jgi:hypothetical protein